jgi:hypothetical protein
VVVDEQDADHRRARPPFAGRRRAAPTTRCTDIGHSTGLTIVRELPSDLPSLGTEVETVIYRVTQESLTNVVRHAGEASLPTPLTARILLADDHVLVRQGLRLILDRQPDLLTISENTVERHRANVLDSFGPRDRVARALYAVPGGLVEP